MTQELAMKISLLRSLLASALSVAAVPAPAEDINLFNTSYSTASAPNVLIFLDNTSNWSANNQAWSKTSVTAKCNGDETCLGYVTDIFGGNSSLTQGQVEVAALKLVLNNLVCQAAQPISVKVGLMLITPNKGTYRQDGGTDNSGVSGIIRKAVLPLVKGGSTCTSLLGDLDTLFSNITGPTFKAASNANYGGPMFEAFKYYGGYTSPAHATDNVAGSPTGHTYYGNSTFVTPSSNSSIVDPAAFTDTNKTVYQSPNTSGSESLCGAKNYILLVGNTWPNKDDSGTPYDPSNLGYGYSSSAFCCVNANGGPRVGDVWAKFLSNTDVSGTSGQQAVYTHTINVYNASADAQQTSLLKSMATNGKGSYFEVGGDLGTLIDSFTSFFQSISATNTAFSSAALPVSVNTQGTYLNNVYIGMFRPSGTARWPGNLKQYKMAFATDTSGQTSILKLMAAGDVANVIADVVAIDSTTGFMKSTVRSNWTPTSADTYWEGMVWPDGMVNQNPVSNFPDGNVVEKGAQGYKLRGSKTATSIARNMKTCDASCGSTLVTFDQNIATSIVNKTALGDSAMSDAQRTALISWERGLNNNGDETFVAATAMRPSAHGDVLHSRPVAVNFGGDKNTSTVASEKPKVVVFYGGNDGLLHAINGNREDGLSIGSAAPGEELWAFVAPEFYGSITNIRGNSPLTFNPPNPTDKPYGVDGPVTAYKYSSTQTWVYAAMRRGGEALYAFNFDVGDSGNPTLKWKIRSADTGFSGLGQTWSSPVVLKAAGYGSGSTPMLFMGGGYHVCEDADPNGCATATGYKGNHIYVLDAETGARLKTLDTDRGVVGDVTVVPDANGLATRAYAADLGGNVYRISTAGDPSTWTITKIAALGGSGSSARKFMFGPDVVLDSGTYYVLVGSGDREKPLTAYTNANGVGNYFFMLKDNATTGITTAVGLSDLTPITSSGTPSQTTLDASQGWYLGLSSGEQVVTSAITLFGVVTFSTHTPPVFDNTTCTSDLGTTRVYNIGYIDAGSKNGTSVRYETVTGGGLPPSPVAGMVTLDNDQTVAFVIGGSSESSLEVKLGGTAPSSSSITFPKSRVYWFIER
jgi:type IV pilus assembly protein PilY1